MMDKYSNPILKKLKIFDTGKYGESFAEVAMEVMCSDGTSQDMDIRYPIFDGKHRLMLMTTLDERAVNHSLKQVIKDYLSGVVKRYEDKKI